MSAVVSTLMRHRDPSSVSGTGPVATVCEFGSGLTAVHWDTDTPSVTVYTDVRHVLQLHGHGGASTLIAAETRLEKAYRLVVPYLLNSKQDSLPLQVAPHPDHPDRLRLILVNYPTWRWWAALLDLSTDTASHEEVDGEARHTVITPDGNVWLIWHSPLADDEYERTDSGDLIVDYEPQADEDPLTTYDREDRG